MYVSTDHSLSIVTPLHLISVLWESDAPAAGNEGPSLLKGAVEKVGGNVTKFNRSLLSTLNKLPVITPAPNPPLPLSNSYHAVLKEAQRLQKEQNDQFVAIDHLLLALMKVDNTGFAELVKAAETTVKSLEGEIRRKRGGRKVDSKSAESQFEALAKCESPVRIVAVSLG